MEVSLAGAKGSPRVTPLLAASLIVEAAPALGIEKKKKAAVKVADSKKPADTGNPVIWREDGYWPDLLPSRGTWGLLCLMFGFGFC